MSFADDLHRFGLKAESSVVAIVDGVAIEALRSVKVGSELTGAPGQPVDSGNLRNSIQLEKDGRFRAVISTNVEYAPPVEDGVGPHGPLTLRSSVGGFRSFAHTVANGDRIVEHVARQVAG